MSVYVVATIKPWNIEAYKRHIQDLPGEWHLITDKEALNSDLIAKLKPRYIFFPHWSWIVPGNVLQSTECVCFHMTDVPYGRGGSPLQNLIVRGHKETKLTALRMTNELDAGPVYSKQDLSLEGTGQEIFERLADLVYVAIDEIVRTEPTPVEQTGNIESFERRTPAMSALPESATLEELYDHIRMLDIETYPRAFIDHGGFRLTFSRADLQDGTVKAEVTVTPLKTEEKE